MSLILVLFEKSIENALIEAEQKDIKGKEITPFLLSKINELTQGKSLQANKGLILGAWQTITLI
jgi:pseudouridine-5'-phosphate glycosidase